MLHYPKIQSVFFRDDATQKFIEGRWARPEFEYLKDLNWTCTEKVDGTNVRVQKIGRQVFFLGKTDDARMLPALVKRLEVLFPAEKMSEVFGDVDVCLYGEGYGAGIGKGGKYLPNSVGFILFDVKIDTWWLEPPNCRDVASKLGIAMVPLVGIMTLPQAVEMVKKGLQSQLADIPAEGIVAEPVVQLFNRKGERIITKVKTRDF